VKWRFLISKEIPRVERVVSQIFECAAMQLIGPRPRCQRHLSSGGVAVLGGVVVADDAEFLERIEWETGYLGWTSQSHDVASYLGNP
jgi:hypothetical protein